MKRRGEKHRENKNMWPTMLILKGQRIISLMLRGCWIEISILKFIKDDKWRRTLFHVQNGNESRFVRHPRFVAPDHAMQQCGQSMAKRALNQFQQAPLSHPIPFFPRRSVLFMAPANSHIYVQNGSHLYHYIHMCSLSSVQMNYCVRPSVVHNWLMVHGVQKGGVKGNHSSKK